MRSLLILLALAISGLAWGDAEVPNSSVGKVFATWFAAYNSSNRQQLEEFKRAYATQWPVEGMLDWRRQTGGFKLLRVEHDDALALTVLVQEVESDTALRISYRLESEHPPLTLTTDVRTVELPPDLSVARLSQADAIEAVVAKADGEAKHDGFSGAVLIDRGGTLLMQKAWGYADRERRIPNAPDTQFRLGSMNKMFTAIAVLQLVEAGKLSLDGYLGDYITDYPNRDVATRVTVRHLLTHTGGTGDIFVPEYMQNRESVKEHADFVKLLGARGLDQEPGASFRYSNYGFVLLGALIEKVSGVSYYEYVDSHIFKPCGMRSTASLPESVAVPKRAVGYMKRDEQWVSNVDTLPYRGMAAGGGYSTVGDLQRFARALLSGKLLSKQLLTEATTRFYKDELFGYGYGFQVVGRDNLTYYGHGGGAPGMNGDLYVFPQLDVIIVVLSNFDPPAADRLANFYANRMPAR